MNVESFVTKKAQKGLDSKIHGKGLFSVETIKKGELVAIKGGHIVSKEVAHELSKDFGRSFLQITDDFFIGPLIMEEVDKSFIYYNHSCEPNMGVKGQIVFVAMRDIEPGEEITVDYATTENDEYSISCNCGVTKCRKTVTGKDWQNKSLQDKYTGYFSWYLQEKIG
jgi:SET domain-containing protein